MSTNPVWYAILDRSFKKNMGCLSGTLQAGDDGTFAKFVLNGKEIPFELEELKPCDHNWPDLSFRLSRHVLMELLEQSNCSNTRMPWTRERVEDLIHRYETTYGVIPDSVRVATTCGQNMTFFGNHYDSLQFHDNVSSESLHLVFYFGSSVKNW